MHATTWMNLQNTLWCVKEARPQRLHIMCFHFNEIFRIGKSIATKCRLVVARDQGEGCRESNCVMGRRDGMMEMFCN